MRIEGERPIVETQLPDEGAGVHPGSPAFGQGPVLIAGHVSLVSGPGPLAGLLKVRKGDRLIGCNSDGTCVSFIVTETGRWSDAQVRSRLIERTDPLFVYTCTPDLRAKWVVVAAMMDPLEEEE
ncbi:MAG TPA: hypothetical protein ENK17_05055 [Anaerolineae bacterium]|nr:hypothetical protein [Anaerolineae bacterium]